MHDFIDPEMGKAIPYGVYDLGADEGWVSVGDDADTAGFAVATISRWWAQMGRLRYPDATRLLVCADAGGSNGYRIRAWKVELAKARQSDRPRDHGLSLPARHLQVEQDRAPALQLHHDELARSPAHLLPGHVQLIANTTTKKGLEVNAELDQGHYPTGVKVTDKELSAVPLTRHEFQGAWNYTVHPQELK